MELPRPGLGWDGHACPECGHTGPHRALGSFGAFGEALVACGGCHAEFTIGPGGTPL